MTKGGVGSGLIWLATAAAGCGVVVGDDGPREVAFHRLCCRQDASVALGAHSEFGSTMEHIIQQFDSDLCVHDFGVGIPAPREQEKDWPHVTSDGPRAFKTKYIAPWFKRRAGRATRERSSRGRGSRSSHGGTSRSSSRDRAELSNMKCATVEVFLKNRYSERCPFQLFTPSYIADIARPDPEIQIGTGQGKLRGEEIVDYVQDKRHMKKELPHFGEGSVVLGGDSKSIISRPLIEFAVYELGGSSLDAKGVVRFIEYATNSRAPTSNIYIQKDELKDVLTVQKLKKLNVVDAIRRLCQKVALRPDENCLKAVPLEYLTPESKVEGASSKANSNFFSRIVKRKQVSRISSNSQGQGLASEERLSGKTVDLSELIEIDYWKSLLKAISIWLYKPNDFRILEETQDARLMDFVLMRAFLAVSGTTNAWLHHQKIEERLMDSSRKLWMLAACAETVRDDDIKDHYMFLAKYFRFTLEGSPRVTFHEVATLADIDSGGGSCAVLAGEHDSLDAERGHFDFLIAYFYRMKGVEGEIIYKSFADSGDPWHFFERRQFLGKFETMSLRTLLEDAKIEMQRRRCSPKWGMWKKFT